MKNGWEAIKCMKSWLWIGANLSNHSRMRLRNWHPQKTIWRTTRSSATMFITIRKNTTGRSLGSSPKSFCSSNILSAMLISRPCSGSATITIKECPAGHGSIPSTTRHSSLTSMFRNYPPFNLDNLSNLSSNLWLFCRPKPAMLCLKCFDHFYSTFAHPLLTIFPPSLKSIWWVRNLHGWGRFYFLLSMISVY